MRSFIFASSFSSLATKDFSPSHDSPSASTLKPLSPDGSSWSTNLRAAEARSVDSQLLKVVLPSGEAQERMAIRFICSEPTESSAVRNAAMASELPMY